MEIIVYASFAFAVVAGIWGTISANRRHGILIPLISFEVAIAGLGAAWFANFVTPRTVLFGAPPLHAALEVSSSSSEIQATGLSVGDCLTLYRSVGPVSFAVMHDHYPGDTWDRRPEPACTLRLHDPSLPSR